MTLTTIKNPRWGGQCRDQKAKAIEQTLRHYVDKPLEQLVCVDLGCGSGGIAFHLASHVYFMTGVDMAPWKQWEEFQKQCPNLKFLQEPVEKISYSDACVDIIICNQVYEHVSEPCLLISEINRILKPGGYCYFAGPNLLFPIEPHIFWPFIHWFPRRFAVWLMRKCGSHAILDAYSTHYWQLRNWLKKFEIYNAVPYILKHPKNYDRNNLFWRGLSILPEIILDALSFASPGFVFILRKPKEK